MSANVKKRCSWPKDDNVLEIAYHDTEWGAPVHDDRKLFEFLLLEGFQAGLSWTTILNKRKNFKKAFDNFDYKKIAAYKPAKLRSLMKDEGIIRNRLKIQSAVTNAQAFIGVQREFGSFDLYIWQFTNQITIHRKTRDKSNWVATTPESDAMSKDLKKRGFKFVGSTICYAFMQAIGMVNDHEIGCFRYREIKNVTL